MNSALIEVLTLLKKFIKITAMPLIKINPLTIIPKIFDMTGKIKSSC